MRDPWLTTESNLDCEAVCRFAKVDVWSPPGCAKSDWSDDRPYSSSDPLVLYSPHAISVVPVPFFELSTCSNDNSALRRRSLSKAENGYGRLVILLNLDPEYMEPLMEGNIRLS